MKLSKRLTAIVDTAEPHGVFCDIGCDHGFVSIELVKRGLAGKVIACDINEGPLRAAEGNIAAAALTEKIETRLSNGLHNITETDNAEGIIIAGMGGILMAEILSEGAHALKNVRQLILQPQSEVYLVRKWLRDNGYNIVNEKMLTDMGKYYVIINAAPGSVQVKNEELQDIFDTYSGYLIGTKDPVLKEYLERSVKANRGYLKNISKDKSGDLEEKIGTMEKVLSMMA